MCALVRVHVLCAGIPHPTAPGHVHAGLRLCQDIGRAPIAAGLYVFPSVTYGDGGIQGGPGVHAVLVPWLRGFVLLGEHQGWHLLMRAQEDSLGVVSGG